MKNIPVYLVLHNIRSVHNVGSLFRSADGAGIGHIYLSGYTPTPIDRFGRIRKDFQKTALGAEHSVPYSYHETLEEVVDLIKKEQKECRLVGIEQDEKSIPYSEIPLEKPLALLLGPEVEGIDQRDLDMCDIIAEIPMHGDKESLNVSIAGSIVMFDIVRRLHNENS